jgi:RNA polymerase sigma-70 factor (ECF subfamily)
MSAAIGISDSRSRLSNGLAFQAPDASIDRPKAAQPHATMPDEWLLVRIDQRDKSAMHALYTRHSMRLYRFIVRLTRDASLAEDLVSDVFIDVWRNAGTYRAQAQVSTWLYAIARHKALSALRRRVDQSLDDDAAAQIEDDASTPEDALIDRNRGELLRACLSKLSTPHREVIDLVYYHEKPIHEVAQIVGVPQNTIKTRLHYARAHIERLLMQSGVTGPH